MANVPTTKPKALLSDRAWLLRAIWLPYLGMLLVPLVLSKQLAILFNSLTALASVLLVGLPFYFPIALALSLYVLVRPALIQAGLMVAKWVAFMLPPGAGLAFGLFVWSDKYPLQILGLTGFAAVLGYLFTIPYYFACAHYAKRRHERILG